MLVVEIGGPSEVVRSVNLEIWAGCDDRGALPLLPWNAPGPFFPESEVEASLSASMTGSWSKSMLRPLCT